MSLTIAHKLSVGVGLYAGLLILLGAFSYLQTGRLQHRLMQLIEHHEPISSASYEMEINLIGTGFGTLAYLDNSAPKHLARVRKDIADFAYFLDNYRAHSKSDEEREFAERISTGYKQFTDLAQRLLQRHDDIATKRTEGQQQLTTLEQSLETRIETDSVKASQLLDEQIRELFRLEEWVVTLDQATANRQESRTINFEHIVQDFSDTVTRYLLLQPAAERWARQTEADFSRALMRVKELEQLKAAQATDLSEFIELRELLDGLLDDEIQLHSRSRLVKAHQEAQLLSEQTLAGLLLAIPLAFAVSIGGGWFANRRIAKPLRRLYTGTQAIAQGDLTWRTQVLTADDEIATLGTAFNHMTEQLQNNLVARSYLEAVFQAMNEALFLLGTDGTIKKVNTSACAWLGYSEKQLLGVNFAQICPSTQTVLTSGTLHHEIEVDLLGQDGATISVSLSVGKLREHVNAPQDWVVLAQDIRDRKYLQQTMLTIVDRERMRSGQELHDSLGQHLTGVAFIAKVLESKLRALDVEEAKDAAWVVTLVNEAVQHTRRLARGLHPVELDMNGLGPALEQLAADSTKLFGIDCVLHNENSVPPSLDFDTANHLYRIAQEALTNALKHGHARSVRIDLSSRRAKLRLRIVDDGTGFDPHQPLTKPSMGLYSMRLRAMALSAKFRIHSRPGKTQVLVTLPIDAPAAEQPEELPTNDPNG